MKLPSKLKNEPLIDALFEYRFETAEPASSVLPGALYGTLEGRKTTQRLPAADIPAQLRNADPNLSYAALVRMEWTSYSILIGDQSLAIASKIPYVGWKDFKPTILSIVEKCHHLNIIQKSKRFSLKYVDILTSDLGSPAELIDVDLRVGPYKNSEMKNFHVRCEFSKDDAIHIIQLASHATAAPTGNAAREGTAIDIDSISLCDTHPKSFLDSLADNLEKLHTSNKEVFFSCLTKKALEKLEPIYE